MMRIRVFPLHHKKKKELLFSELSSEIKNYRVFNRKIAIYFNLLKQVQKLTFNDLYCCLTIKTFQLEIICLKFVKFYTFRNLSLKISRESSKNLDEKLLFCSLQKILFQELFLFFYIMRIRVFPLQNKKKIVMSSTYFFQN